MKLSNLTTLESSVVPNPTRPAAKLSSCTRTTRMPSRYAEYVFPSASNLSRDVVQ
jgi:hypothetical protein